MKCTNINELFYKVINNDYCSGCGVCASVKDSHLKMQIDENGKYRPFLDNSGNSGNNVDVLSICPFYNNERNEDIIGKKLFERVDDIKHNKYIGYYLKNFAGYVNVGDYRKSGSSGGMGSWISSKLIELGLIDAIIHVKQTKDLDEKVLFNYQVSKNLNEISEGGKSKYYPVEMSEVIKYIKENEGRYALVGVPCFIKAIRLLSEKDEVVSKRIKFTIGLVCGHLKSEMFAKSIGWQMGIHPNDIRSIDFRVKIENCASSNYGVKVVGEVNKSELIKESPTRLLYMTNWGEGMFKYKSCDYCDDVLAETADITIGDAWIPEYTNDSMGTNIIVVRNSQIMNIINKYRDELFLEELSEEKIFESQAGGFRHRREGLSYRLYLTDKKNQWRPKKRVDAENSINKNRKKIYENRIKIYEESFRGYKLAEKSNNFNDFISYMNPIINHYKRLIHGPLIIRVLKKIKRVIVNE
ncbi:Coenzyme F420 hydrogenase/dehydrogenase, beta subunit C-terminal domain [Clostridium tertium]